MRAQFNLRSKWRCQISDWIHKPRIRTEVRAQNINLRIIFVKIFFFWLDEINYGENGEKRRGPRTQYWIMPTFINW